MTDDNALEMLHKLFDEAGASCMQVDNYLNVAIGDLRANFSEYKDGTLCMTLQNFVTPEQAIAVTLGSERELIDLAHNAWSMALCAMQGMPIPAEWGDAVERGLRKYGINVDEELAGFEVIDE